jgi:hypothetical protein
LSKNLHDKRPLRPSGQAAKIIVTSAAQNRPRSLFHSQFSQENRLHLPVHYLIPATKRQAQTRQSQQAPQNIIIIDRFNWLAGFDGLSHLPASHISHNQKCRTKGGQNYQ